MTRVLALTNWYPPHHYGGYELSCYDVMTRLEARGHDVGVLCSEQRLPGVADPLSGHEAEVRRRLKLYIEHGDQLLSPPLRERWSIERHNQRMLDEALAEFRPDVVAVWHMGALSLGLVTTLIERRMPLVYAICDDWLIYEPLHNDAWTRLFERSRPRRWAARVLRPVLGVPTSLPDLGASGGFCFVSDYTKRKSEEHAPWHYPLSAVVYSGIDLSSFPPAADRERPWQWRLVYVGRFDPRKGTETLVRALALLPRSATLAMYGRGGERERARLEKLASELGVRDQVTFAQLDREELAARYADADVCVFPVEWDEPFGLAPVEAMACATPVVATGTGGSREFLEDGGNCVLFAPGRPEGLVEAIMRLERDPELRRHIVRGGLRTARELDVERLADEFERWYEAAAAGYRSGRPAQRPSLVSQRES